MCMICSTFNPFITECPYGSDMAIVPSAAQDGGSQGTETNGFESIDAPTDASTPYDIAFGEFFYGSLSGNSDVDWIAVDLAAGTEFTIAVVGVGALDSQLNDSVL